MLLVISLLFSLFYSGLGCSKEVPKWKTSYSLRGIYYYPMADIEEPFQVWYDGSSNEGRIDYYHGMQKVFMKANEGFYGNSYYIFPVTTENETNVNICYQEQGTRKEKIKPIQVLPNMKSYECKGTDILENVECEKWEKFEMKGNLSYHTSIWLSFRYDSETSEKISIPIKYEMKKYNKHSGKLLNHYFIEYDSFESKKPHPEAFKLQPELLVKDIPNKRKYLYTIHPLSEAFHPNIERHIDHAFNIFKEKHQVNYDNEEEHNDRKSIFLENLQFINSVNRQNKGYKLDINYLADKTEEELKVLRGRIQPIPNTDYNDGQEISYQKQDEMGLPKEFDWRPLGAVGPVKNQFACGSCWSFAVTGAVEGAYFVKYNEFISLSEQALVDCSWGFGNNGCYGGEQMLAYKWIMKHNGIPTDESYGPYMAMNGYCHADNLPKKANITGFVKVKHFDVNALKVAIVKHGPVSVSIDAGPKSFDFYSSGVLYEPKCHNSRDKLNHAVLAVGYGTLNGKSYWLIKNSWSHQWGQNGYLYLSTENNNCGVLSDATYVTF